MQTSKSTPFITVSNNICIAPSTTALLIHDTKGVYPHLYGATYSFIILINDFKRLSTCVWGHLPRVFSSEFNNGSIPMRMGPPYRFGLSGEPSRVYPHVYGATSINF